MIDSAIDFILGRQRRCVECGSCNKLEIHHRIFRSTGEAELQRLLTGYIEVYKNTHDRVMEIRGMHDIQNLVVLCNGCHTKIHSGFRGLRMKYEESFTCPTTGFNVSYQRDTTYR